MIPGMGAVATTLIAGVEAIRTGMAKPGRFDLSNGNHSARELIASSVKM
jgi:hypothetical protein